MTSRLVWHSVRWLWNDNIDHQKEKYRPLQSGWVEAAVHDDCSMHHKAETAREALAHATKCLYWSNDNHIRLAFSAMALKRQYWPPKEKYRQLQSGWVKEAVHDDCSMHHKADTARAALAHATKCLYWSNDNQISSAFSAMALKRQYWPPKGEVSTIAKWVGQRSWTWWRYWSYIISTRCPYSTSNVHDARVLFDNSLGLHRSTKSIQQIPIDLCIVAGPIWGQVCTMPSQM